tara:strand:+ start:201 stop:377 length:177 start_codon:yes stop_codon:yes gene_type:complete
MKIGDLVRARYNTGLLGIITKIERNQHGHKFKQYTVLWNNGKTGYLYDSYLEAVKKCP